MSSTLNFAGDAGKLESTEQPLTTPIYNPSSGRTVNVPKSEVATYEKAGFRSGEDAELAKLEEGTTGKLATGALGLARGATLGLSDMLLGRGVHNIAKGSEAAHPAIKVLSEIAGSIPTLEGAGALAGSAASVLPASRALLAAGGRVGATAVEGGARAAAEQVNRNDPITAEHVLSGLGLGAFLGLVGEGASVGLTKVGPAFQRATNRGLDAVRPYFNRSVEHLDGTADAVDALKWSKGTEEFHNQLKEAYPVEPDMSQVDPMAGTSREFAPGSVKPGSGPPPMPPGRTTAHGPVDADTYRYIEHHAARAEDAPWAKALHMPSEAEESAYSEAVRNRAKGLPTVESRKAALDHEPLSAEDARAAWDELDRAAKDASMSGQSDLAADLRSQRDYFSQNRGMDGESLDAWRAKQAELKAADPEVDKAFDRAGFNGPMSAENLPPMPSMPEPLGFTDVPETEPGAMPSAEPTATGPELQPSDDFSGVKPPKGTRPYGVKGNSTTNLGKEATAGTEEPLPSLPGEDELARSRMRNSDSTLGSREKVTYTAKGAGLPNIGKAGALGYILHAAGLHPALAGSFAAIKAAERATAFALNHQAAVNNVIETLISKPLAMMSKSARQLIQGTAGDFVPLLSGNTDKDYQAVTKSVRTLANNPTLTQKVIQQKLGGPLQNEPQLYANIVAKISGAIQFLAGSIPKQSAQPTLMDADYNPPRTEKLKLLQAYVGVNDPYTAFMNPTPAGMLALQAVHPAQLERMRHLVLADMASGKIKRLTPERRRALSLVLGMPVGYANSPAAIAKMQATAQAQAASPAQPPQQGGHQNQPKQKTINLGAQAKNFANMTAPPTMQDQLVTGGQ